MAARVLRERELNRAALARQLLLERVRMPLPRVLDAVAGLRAQYAPSMYVGLWSRVEGFTRAALTAALENRTVIQATLMRGTIHLVSAADYWPCAHAIRGAQRSRWLATQRGLVTEQDMTVAATQLATVLGDGPLRRAQIDSLIGRARAGGVGLWVDLVLPRAPLPDPAAVAPVRFLPVWEAVLLVHARRTGVVAEEHRAILFTSKNPHSVNTFLVDGRVAGTWRYQAGAIEVNPLASLNPADERQLAQEAERLAAFHA